MDTTEQWEFCSLDLFDIEYRDDKKRNRRGWECNLTIFYIGQEVVKERLCNNDWQDDENKKTYKEIWSQNPWQTALGVLGSIG